MGKKWLGGMGIVALILLVLFLPFVNALPVGSCSPDSCPEGYRERSEACVDGVCTKECVTVICEDTYTTVSTQSLHLPDENYGGNGVSFGFVVAGYTPTNTSKCYRFRQTTPSKHMLSQNRYLLRTILEMV